MRGWVAGGAGEVVELTEGQAGVAGGREEGRPLGWQHQDPRLRTFWLQGALLEMFAFGMYKDWIFQHKCKDHLGDDATHSKHSKKPHIRIRRLLGCISENYYLAGGRSRTSVCPPEAMMSREDVEL